MKKYIISGVLAMLPVALMAQSAIDAFSLSQTDFRGTARFMAMGGAFGALGGDITCLTQNPAGIGVYRSSDVSVTLDVDMQTSKSDDMGYTEKTSQTKVSCNSAGYVGAYRIDSESLRTFNWGFTYNRNANRARHFMGQMRNLSTSLSNYVAGVTNSEGWTAEDLAGANYGTSYAPWMSILAYDGSLINPQSDGKSFQGLYGDGTSGYGEYEVVEEGGVDEFNLSFGGNVKDLLYWGITVGMTDVDYKLYSYYGESLDNAYINSDITGVGDVVVGPAAYAFENYLHTTGTGYNVKLGLILRPTNAFRVGVAFHTPTYYSLKDYYYTSLGFNYGGQQSSVETNDGFDGETWYKLRTPWRFIGSVASVIGQKGILSFDYEYVAYNSMSLKDDYGNAYTDTNYDIKNYYKGCNIIRVGGEYRVDRQLSLRAGYSYQSSPVDEDALNNKLNIYTVSTTPAYSFDKSTQYYTFGMGYKFGPIYADLTYVHKTRETEYHAFSPIPDFGEASPSNIVKDNNDRIVATIGFRF
ncbi:MAG: OmpP1/FadL family transporter [Muribaculaceae bacterium]